MSSAQRQRAGFTLVELLVSTALIAFILVILAQAFETATDSVRLLKAQGDMQDKLRAATIAMKADLRADHFLGAGPKLSDQDLSINQPPAWGVFRIMQGSAPSSTNQYYTYEGSADGVASNRAVDHNLFFSRRGTDGNWYLVSYCLRPNGDFAGQTSLYSLYREQVLVTSTAGTSQLAVPTLDVSIPVSLTTGGTPLPSLISPTTLLAGQTTPSLSFFRSTSINGLPSQNVGYYAYPILSDLGVKNDPAVGDDLMLADVISFEIQILTPQANGGASFVSLFDSSLDATRNTSITDFYNPKSTVSTTPPPPAVFDSWTQKQVGGNPVTPPMAIRVLAIQVTLRIWDDRTQQARQISFIQAM